MGNGVNLMDITKAADQLLAAGEKPTVDGVRALLGTGTPGAVNALLKEYYQALPSRLNLPAPIAIAAADLYAKLSATALEEVTEKRAELERQVAEDREQLAQDRRGFEAENTALKGQVVQLSADLDRLQEHLRALTAKIAMLEKELAIQSSRATTAEAQYRAAEEERERTQQRHLAEVVRLREQALGNEQHLQLRIEEQKTQHQQLLNDRDREAAIAGKRITTLELSVSESSKLHASLRAELATAQRETGKWHEAAVAAENALVRAQERAAKELATQREEIDRWREEVNQLTSANEYLKRERDDAIREAARLEGRLAATEGQLREARMEVRRLQSSRAEAGPTDKLQSEIRLESRTPASDRLT